MRRCGSCTLCCTVDAVPDISKPRNTPCVFCSGKECKIYQTRPRTCREYECEWLKGNLPFWMRPDRVHVVVEQMPGVAVVSALPEPGHERTWRTKRVVDVLRMRYQAQGIAVVSSDMMGLIPEGKTAAEIGADIALASRRILGLAPR